MIGASLTLVRMKELLTIMLPFRTIMSEMMEMLHHVMMTSCLKQGIHIHLRFLTQKSTWK